MASSASPLFVFCSGAPPEPAQLLAMGEGASPSPNPALDCLVGSVPPRPQIRKRYRSGASPESPSADAASSSVLRRPSARVLRPEPAPLLPSAGVAPPPRPQLNYGAGASPKPAQPLDDCSEDSTDPPAAVAVVAGGAQPPSPPSPSSSTTSTSSEHPVIRRRPAAKARAKRRAVLEEGAAPSRRGLRQDDIDKNKNGRVVSKCVSQQKKQEYGTSVLRRWNDAVKRARERLGNDLHGRFVPCGGKSPEGQRLLETVRAIRRVEGW